MKKVYIKAITEVANVSNSSILMTSGGASRVTGIIISGGDLGQSADLSL